MTVCAILFGLVADSCGRRQRRLIGVDVMKRIAAPMIGGVVTSAILELLLYPAIYLPRHLATAVHCRKGASQFFAGLNKV